VFDTFYVTLKSFQMLNFDSGIIFKHELTDEGYLRCYMRVARTGDLKYYSADGKEQIQTVESEVLFDKSSIASLKTIPITREHPFVAVDSTNASTFGRGLTTPYVMIDGDFLGVMGTITDKVLIDEIMSGERTECSAGYYTDLEELPDGRFKQKKRKYNHLAIVTKGRAGKEVKVQLDSEEWVSELICDQNDTFLKKQPIAKTMKFKLNGFQFETDDESLVEAAASMNATVEKLTGEADALSLNVDSLESKVSTLEADKETLSNELETQKNIVLDAAPAIDVPSVVGFWMDALPKLKELDAAYQPDYSMSQSDVRKLLISKKYPQLDFEGKSEEYLAGFYDYALVATPAVEPEVKEEVLEDSEELNSDSDPLIEAVSLIAENRAAKMEVDAMESYVKSLEEAWM
jgi:uncharacterized protein